MFLCCIYFRLANFRRELLADLLTGEERKTDIIEWRGTDFPLDAASLSKLEEWQLDYQHRLSLDWSGLDERLISYFGKSAVEDALAELPTINESWLKSITSRRLLFFSFLEQWAKYVYQTIPESNRLRLQWHLLPGYPTLLKALLIEMKARDVMRFPDALLNCTGALLANERLLSVFTKIVFLKTSVYDQGAVFAALNYVDYWMQVLSLRDQPLPPNFDGVFLTRGLDIVLGSEIALSMAKSIWFVYKNLTKLRVVDLKGILIDLFMTKYFYTLFLSWSWLVRRCFVWFLLYRICHQAIIAMDHLDSLTYTDKLALWGYLELRNFLAIMDEQFQPDGLKFKDIVPAMIDSKKIYNALLLKDPVTNDRDETPKNRSAVDLNSRLMSLYAAETLSPRERVMLRPISSDMRIYVKSAINDFQSEMPHFKEWLDSGSTEPPIMNIPASPLDSNVDVPPENW